MAFYIVLTVVVLVALLLVLYKYLDRLDRKFFPPADPDENIIGWDDVTKQPMTFAEWNEKYSGNAHDRRVQRRADANKKDALS